MSHAEGAVSTDASVVQCDPSPHQPLEEYMNDQSYCLVYQKMYHPLKMIKVMKDAQYLEYKLVSAEYIIYFGIINYLKHLVAKSTNINCLTALVG